MKKFIFGSLLIGSFGMNIYLMNSEVVIHDEFDDEILEEIDDEITLAQSAIQKIERGNFRSPTITEKPKIAESRPLKDVINSSTKEKAEQFDEYDYSKQLEQVRSDWNRKLMDVLITDLKISEDVLVDYQEMQKNLRKETDNFMQPLLENYSSDEPYFFTIEDSVAISKINEKYIDKLKKLLGDAGYQLYKKTRIEYNKKMIEQEKFQYNIDF